MSFSRSIKDPKILAALAKISGREASDLVTSEPRPSDSYDIRQPIPPDDVIDALLANPWPLAFIADQNMHGRTAYLRLAGLEITSLTRRGLQKSSRDETIFAHAKKYNLILVTCDADFLDCTRFNYTNSPGVVVLSTAMGIRQLPHDSPMLKAALDHMLSRLPRSGWKVAHYTKKGLNLFPEQPLPRLPNGALPDSVIQQQYYTPT